MGRLEETTMMTAIDTRHREESGAVQMSETKVQKARPRQGTIRLVEDDQGMKRRRLRNGIKLLGSGSYIPEHTISAGDFDEHSPDNQADIPPNPEVQQRHFLGSESIASMASRAIREALENARIGTEEIDLLIAAGGTPDEADPHPSSSIHRELQLPDDITPIDVDATCLSFVQALQLVGNALRAGAYRNVIIVNGPESAYLPGGGAVAFVLGQGQEEERMPPYR